MQLSDWIEQNIRLPEGVSALLGAIRLYPARDRRRDQRSRGRQEITMADGIIRTFVPTVICAPISLSSSLTPTI
jgi:hypothetical protein